MPFQLPLTHCIQNSLANHMAAAHVWQSSAKQRAAWKALRSCRNPHPIYQVKNSGGWELTRMKFWSRQEITAEPVSQITALNSRGMGTSGWRGVFPELGIAGDKNRLLVNKNAGESHVWSVSAPIRLAEAGSIIFRLFTENTKGIWKSKNKATTLFESKTKANKCIPRRPSVERER